MTAQPELYAGLSGGRVLDVGTGRGGWAEELAEQLADYEEIIGIDIDATLAEAFAATMQPHPRARFEVMDGMAMTYPDASFDTVAIAGSLHHLADPEVGLREMARVLKPGGYFIVAEMYRDGQTETQQTHVRLHHWWGAVDRLRGVSHRETYTRRQVMNLVNALGLDNLVVRDDADRPDDPRNAAQIARLEPGIDTYLAFASGHPDLIAEGEQIRKRLHRVGLHLASVLVAVGEKPQTD